MNQRPMNITGLITSHALSMAWEVMAPFLPFRETVAAPLAACPGWSFPFGMLAGTERDWVKGSGLVNNARFAV